MTSPALKALKALKALTRKRWNLSEFQTPHLPVIVGSINDERMFTFKNIRVLDMPIYMPGQGWCIPPVLEQFLEAINLTREHEGLYGYEDTHYVYITVDQKIVQKGSTGRRPGLHTDAFGGEIDEEVTHTYILSDMIPTRFFSDCFPISTLDCQESIDQFKMYAKNPAYYPCKQLLLLDPYVVHESMPAHMNTQRTFVKISYSRKKYNRTDNTLNELFDYSWEFIPRDRSKRNDPSTSVI
jgi:hypothetical protein